MSELAIICEGGMLVRDGKIESVGPSDEMEKNVGDAEIVDARGRSVMPGFVDAHTHLVFAGNRLEDFESRRRNLVNGRKNACSERTGSSRAGKKACELVSALRDYDSRSEIRLWPHR